MSARALLTAGLFAAASLLATPAFAQHPALDPVAAEAQQLFAEGREAVKHGDFALAVDKLTRSVQLHPAAGTLLNLAAAEEQLGKLVSAAQHFDDALRLLPGEDERVAIAKQGLDRLRARIPTLRIDRAAGQPPELVIRVEGAPLAASAIGAPQPMDRGSYAIVTSAPGREDRSYRIKLDDGARVTLVVEAGPPLAVAPPPVAKKGPTAAQTAGFAVLGVGVAGLVIGGVTGALAIVEKNHAASACPEPSRCDAAGLEASGRAHTFAGVSTGAFVAGLAGTAAGVTLILAGGESSSPAAPPPRSATLSPWFSPQGAGLGARVRF